MVSASHEQGYEDNLFPIAVIDTGNFLWRTDSFLSVTTLCGLTTCCASVLFSHFIPPLILLSILHMVGERIFIIWRITTIPSSALRSLILYISHITLEFCNSQVCSLISFSVDGSEKFLSDVGSSENDWCYRQTLQWGQPLLPWISYRGCQGNTCLTCPLTLPWPPSCCHWLRESSGRSQLGATRAYSLISLWLHC